MTLHHCNLDAVKNELMTSAQVSLRQTTLEYFNTVSIRYIIQLLCLSLATPKTGSYLSYTYKRLEHCIPRGDTVTK